MNGIQLIKKLSKIDTLPELEFLTEVIPDVKIHSTKQLLELYKSGEIVRNLQFEQKLDELPIDNTNILLKIKRLNPININVDFI